MIIYGEGYTIDCEKDCQSIKDVLESKGYEYSLQECFDLWKRISEDAFAGWLDVPSDDNLLWDCFLWDYMEEI